MSNAPHTHQASGKDKISNGFGWVWFHNHCHLVTVDKTRPEQYKGKQITVVLNGETHKVICSHHEMDGTHEDLVAAFLESPEYQQWKKENPGEEIAALYAKKCICPCIRKAQVNECACRTCTEFSAALGALRKQHKEWHAEEECKCDGCSDPDAIARYEKALLGVTSFRNTVCCPKQDYPHLKLPHTPDIVPSFHCLKCCKDAPDSPPHIDQCMECGVHTALYRNEGCIDRTEEEASWMMWQPTEVDAGEKSGGTTSREVYRLKTGTRKELVDRVCELAPKYLCHAWVHKMTTHLGKLHVATFDGEFVIIVKADFAATVVLKSEAMATCEFARHTNMYVALVLHSPDTGPIKPGVSA